MGQIDVEQVKDLLKQAVAAHHEYEQNELGGVYHEEWPEWYADWLIAHGLNDRLGQNLEAAALAARLKAINDDHQQAETGKSWARYTAEALAGG